MEENTNDIEIEPTTTVEKDELTIIQQNEIEETCGAHAELTIAPQTEENEAAPVLSGCTASTACTVVGDSIISVGSEMAVSTADVVTVEHGEVTITPQTETPNTAPPPAVQTVQAVQAGITGEIAPTGEEVFIWHLNHPPADESRRLMLRLAETGMFFRSPEGAIHRMQLGRDIVSVTSPVQMEASIRDAGLIVQVVDREGRVKSMSIPQSDLRYLLAATDLKDPLPVVDVVTSTSHYSGKWQLAVPGYNDFGPRERVFFTGETVTVSDSMERINAFLDAMSFAGPADRANAVAALLTRILRVRWPGAKPFVPVTANRSHAGKDTVLSFVSGSERTVEVSYSPQDWPLQIEVVRALTDPGTAMIVLANVRLNGTAIASSFIERMVTDGRPMLQSTKQSGVVRRPADFLFAASVNGGRFSMDLLNRALPIHLEMKDDIAERKHSIGDPRWEYLPRYRAEIEAEAHGMIHRWIEAGRPLASNIRHPMTDWAATVGGILDVNGIKGFLENWEPQRSSSDPVIEEFAQLALRRPDEYLRVAEWVEELQMTGGHKIVIDAVSRNHRHRTETALGTLLNAHENCRVHAEEMSVENDEVTPRLVVFRLRRHRGRIDGGEPKVRYAFVREAQPEAGPQ